MRPVLRTVGVLALLVAALGLLATRLVTPPPVGEQVSPPPGFPRRVEVVLGARVVGWGRVDPQGVVWLPADLVREHFDPALRVVPGEKAQTSTSPWRLPMSSPAVARFVQDEPVLVEFYAPGGLVPVEALQELYGISVQVTGARVLVDRAGREVPLVRATVPLRVRARPWPLWPGKAIPAGTSLLVYDQVGGWLLVRTGEGLTGYVPAGRVERAGTYRVSRPERVPPVRVRGPVCLAWEHVTRPGGPDLAAIGPLPGVNAVSPTWLHLHDADGTLASGCNASYVRWAHHRGYAVWVLVGNQFDPDLTRQVLEDDKARRHLIRQLLVYSRLFALDGINVDFENVYPAQKQSFVRFVEELSRLARQEGLVVSVDVTVKSPSPTWSGFLDRRALARSADYLALMAYDEHYAGSPRAGSVASLPWVEKGIRGLLEEVPPEKLLLGLPLYTRLWKEEPSGGGRKLTSQALGMQEIQSILDEKGVEPGPDPASGQDYASWKEDGMTFRVWLENERSLRARLELAARYRLAGVAFWRRGFETPAIWDIVARELGELR